MKNNKLEKENEILQKALEMAIGAHLTFPSKWPGCNIICPNRPCESGCIEKIASHFIALAERRKGNG